MTKPLEHSSSAHLIYSFNVQGAKTIVANVIGTVGGGVVARHWKLGLKGCVKLITITRLIAFLLACFNYMFGCDNFDISGFDMDSAQVSPVVFKKDNT